MRKQLSLKKVLFLVLLLGVTTSKADTYTIDPAHTWIGFSSVYMLVSPVRGNFQEYSGTITLNGKDVTSLQAEGTIKTASITTFHAKRDKHLKSPDFFDVEKYPHITFKSKKITKKGNQYVAVGDFTIKNTTKEVEIPFTISGPVKNPYGQMVIGIEGSLTINRQDYGVSWNKSLDKGGVLVSNDIKIDLKVQAKK